MSLLDGGDRDSQSGLREHGAPAPAAAEAAAGGGPLGSTQNNCTPPSEIDRRRVRFAARAVLWQASTLYPVRTCGRHLAPVVDRSSGHPEPIERHAVEVQRRGDNERGSVAGYGGLAYCGNVWACPRCSAVVAAERSAHIAAAVAECHSRGGQVHFVTLTLRHRAGDRVKDLFPILHAGWRAVTGSVAWTGNASRGKVGDRDRFGVGGFVRVIETTVSRPGSGGHGWHIHVHALLFSMGTLVVGLRPDYERVLARMAGRPVTVDAEWFSRMVFQARVADRWIRGVTNAGGRVPGAAAVDVRTIEDGGAEFVGRYLAKGTYDVATRLGAEVAAGDLTKSAREASNVTPFDLLAELVVDGPKFGLRTPRRWEIGGDADGLDLLDLDSGELTAIRPPGGWALWVEWEQATRGRRQLAWAHRPKQPATDREQFWLALLDARGAGAEVDDADLAAREVGGVVLGDIPRAAWYSRLVWRPSWLVDVLEAAERGGDDLRRWMADRGIDYDPR